LFNIRTTIYVDKLKTWHEAQVSLILITEIYVVQFLCNIFYAMQNGFLAFMSDACTPCALFMVGIVHVPTF